MIHVKNATAGDDGWVDVAADTRGCVVYGPYAELATGRFKVAFDITADVSNDVARVDVVTNSGTTVLAERVVQAGVSELDFDLANNSVVEFRVHALGQPFRVAYERPLAVVLDGAEAGRFLTLRGDVPDFVRKNYSAIRRLAELGVDFDVGETITATVQGITCRVHSEEELQLFTELFFINEYTFTSPVECIAIDIGMNVGLTSLLLANNPMVAAVYSFEPFATPYARAAANIAMNPRLEPKITAYPFGLADRTEALKVKVQDTNTVGVSIAGTSVGAEEIIHIASAAETLRPILAAAKAAGQRVVMKVDCEGSEFAIFDDLERAGLFKSIDVMMIEWHKWWDPAKTQANLMRPMVESGLFVFDRTNPDNPMAGSLYAVRL